jgi:hypothetical protein
MPEHHNESMGAGLTAAMYLPANCSDFRGEVGSPDDEAGLHVRSHDGSVVRVAARKDQLLFQVGQSLQVLLFNCAHSKLAADQYSVLYCRVTWPAVLYLPAITGMTLCASGRRSIRDGHLFFN